MFFKRKGKNKNIFDISVKNAFKSKRMYKKSKIETIYLNSVKY